MSRIDAGRGRLAKMVLPAAVLLALLLVALLTRSGPEPAAHPAAEPTPAASAGRVERFSFYSPTLARTMSIAVFLPPGYDSGEASYPVLYMLHGVGWGDPENWEWETWGIFEKGAELMKSGEVAPFLIALPQGEQSYWVDHADGPAWGAYLANDVVAAVDGRFRTVRSAGQRAVGGLSMGADGALQVAIVYPRIFGVVGLHSPVLRPYADAPPFFGSKEYFEAHFPPSLVQAQTELARSLIIEMDAGDVDVWLANATAFHQQLESLGVAHEWHVWQGGHSGEYWAAHVGDYLRFYGSAFSRATN